MSNLSRGGRGRGLLVSAGLILFFGACAGDGCGCGMEPLPGGALPADQTIEGGGQVRVTASGMNKVEQIISGAVNDALGEGMCLPSGSQGVGVGDVDWCYQNQGTCTPGCQVNINVDYVNLDPLTDQLRIRTQLDVSTAVPVRFDPIIGGSSSCTLNVSAQNTLVDAIVALGIRPSDGELTVTLLDIPALNLNPSITGCGAISDILDFLVGAIADTLAVDIVRDLLTPLLDDLLQGMLPDPMGVEGVIDVASLFGGVAPGTRAGLELRVAPGGYVQVQAGGLNLGIITGMNADEDPATRTAELDSEPALCVPPIPAPDFAAAPASLSQSSRGTFRLLPAGAFTGQGGDVAGTDVVIGLSETFLDLTGHHAVTSGAMCLGLGTELVPQLNLGAIGVVVPSLAELGSDAGDDPLLLVTRPQRAVDFTIGEGTEQSPSLTVHVHDFEIDFYAFLFERYVRGFSVRLDLDVGINLEFTTDAEGNPAVMPILVGLESSNIGLTVLNEEFLREDAAELEAVLPSILDLVLPLIAGGLPPVALPEFLGFQLDQLTMKKVTTSEDDFLALSATLGPSQMLTALAERFPSVKRATDGMARPAAAPVRLRRAAVSLVRVTTPPPEQIRAALLGTGGAMPEVVLQVPTSDELGRTLEWTWSLDGGLWRPFRAGGELVLRDGAFAIQGRYAIHLRSRVAGDYRTLSQESAVVPVVIDSVGPRIFAERAAVEAGSLRVPAVDLVSAPEAVELAFGRLEDDEPATAWGPGSLSLARAAELGAMHGALVVHARDELGNRSSAVLELDGIVQFHGGEGGGCQCAIGGEAGGGGLASGGLLALAALIGLGARRRRRGGPAGGRPARRGMRLAGLGRLAAVTLALGAAATLPACSCGDPAAATCELDEECAEGCAEGQVPICIDGTCACLDEVPWGRIGQYSEMAVAGDGTIWVSGYNARHGDLMIASTRDAGRIPDEAWEFVDGVPDGPVSVPNGSVRGGVNEPGPDVGLYTDIAVAGDTVLVSYFDRDRAALRLAVGTTGAWSLHDVEVGAPSEPDGGYSIVGQYSSITLRSDGRPGIAYFAHVSDGAVARTELRFAEATTASPAGPGDWTVTVVDSAEVPEGAEEDPLPIPMGVGLFVNATRLSDDSPVLVYYDRLAGDLKAARPGEDGFVSEVLDGDGVDVGWYPGVAVDAEDQLHVSYVSASNDDLLYVNTIDRTPEVIDDGYRLVGTTEDGLPVPEFHFVGDDSSLVLTEGGPFVAYQDATSHELRLASRNDDGTWTHEPIAGHESTFAGGYGFYASAAGVDGGLAISTWVLDQPSSQAWVEIFWEAIAVE